jgi:tetratricopeptide (TPR) repeat protein
VKTNLWACVGLCLAALGAALCCEARADVVVVGQRQWTGAKFQTVQDGRVRFTAGDGTQQAVLIATVSRLEVDLRDDLNRAEQLQSDGKAAEAIPAFEAALRSESRNDLGGFIRYRLMDLYGRSGQLDLAVEMFLDLVKQPDFYVTVKDWRPVNLAVKPKTKEAALTELADGLRQIRTGLASESVGQLREFLETRKTAPAGTVPPASAAAGAKSPRSADQPAEPEEPVETGETTWPGLRLLQQGQYGQALQAANLALGQQDLSREQLADVLYARGVAQWSVARNPAQVLEAGWALARVLVEFPASRRVPECQYYLGLVHQRMGKTAQARQLLQQARQSPAASADLRNRAEKALRDMAEKD